MLCVAQHSPVRVNRKIKTWKFAAKFLWKNSTVQSKSELGQWTRNELLELGPTFVKLVKSLPREGTSIHPNLQKNWKRFKMTSLPWNLILM